MLRLETKGRARALQLLYAADTTGREPAAVLSGVVRLTRPKPMVLDFALDLAGGVAADRAVLDRRLEEATEHWRLDRLSAVDRNILRIATLEMARDSVPPLVAIDEALWLAHRFGTPASPGFVNGVLDRVARALGRL